MKFSGMIFHHPRTNLLEFGGIMSKAQGHEKVKHFCQLFQFSSDSYETNDKCGSGEGMCSTKQQVM